jgi:DNA polymerase-1
MLERYVEPIPHTPRHIHLVQDENRVDKAVSHLLKFDVLGFDLETYHSVDRYKPAFDPTNGAKMRLAQFATPEGRVFLFDLYKVSPYFLYRMFPNTFLCVIQNAKFDLKYLMWELGIWDFGPIFDTMNAEKVLSKGNTVYSKDRTGTYVPVGLDDIAWRRLKVKLPKDEQASHWYKSQLSEKQLSYAARDPMILLPIFDVQRQLLVEQSQMHVAELEFGVTPAVASMELNGIHLDTSRWLEMCEKTERDLHEIKKDLWRMLGKQQSLFIDADVEPINLNSKPDVTLALEECGIKIPIDKEGKPTRPEIQQYLKYVKLDKARSSYGPDWVDKVNPFDERIHCSINTMGAETGRMSANGPNLMQMKKEDAYRNCFTPEDGWVFIDADYSQCELRILAEYCRDQNLIHAFDMGYDLHRYTAHLIFKVAMEMVEDFQRAIAKNLNFGIVYGIGVAKFAAQAGIPFEEAEVIMRYYLKEAYPSMGQWLDTQGRSVLYNMEARTMTGRIRRYSGDLNDKQFKAAVQRNAKNLPIQGTNADILKRALALLYEEVKGHKNIKLVLPIHDEILTEARPEYAREAAHKLKASMLQAEREYLHRVKSKVDVNLSLVWSKEPTKEQKAEALALVK